LYPVLLHKGHISFSQSFLKNTKEIQSPWRRRQNVPPKHQKNFLSKAT